MNRLVRIGRIGRARRALRRLGPTGFLRLCAYNLRLLASGRAREHAFVYDDAWDRRHGLDTAGMVDVAEIAAPDALKEGAVRYEPTPPDCFAFLIAAAGIEDAGAWTLVDLGSGKGRVPLLAAMAGFGRSIGVELGSDLHAIACANLIRFRARQALGPVEFVQKDARSFGWPDGRTTCFLNNPFSGDILDEVLNAIEASLAAAPRAFRIVYYHSNHLDRIDRRPAWIPVQRGNWRDASHHYAIWRWAGTPA
jgi:predicted RNA methylase